MSTIKMYLVKQVYLFSFIFYIQLVHTLYLFFWLSSKEYLYDMFCKVCNLPVFCVWYLSSTICFPSLMHFSSETSSRFLMIVDRSYERHIQISAKIDDWRYMLWMYFGCCSARDMSSNFHSNTRSSKEFSLESVMKHPCWAYV